MFLSDVLKTLCSERAISAVTISQYQRSIDRLSEFLGRVATVSDLNYATINAYLLWLESDRKLSAVSVRNHRIGIICLWNYAVFPMEVTAPFTTRRIRCPRIPRKPVVAWSLPDVGKLLQAAIELQGRLRNGLPVALLLESWIRLGTETGLRPSDLRTMTWEQIDFANRSVAVCQSKTKEPIVCGFSTDTAIALRKLFKWKFSLVFPIGKSGIWKLEQRLYKIAQLVSGFNRQPRQGLGTLRKTHGTEVYREYGLSAASESLGHRSGTRIAKDHYIDSAAHRQYQIRLG